MPTQQPLPGDKMVEKDRMKSNFSVKSFVNQRSFCYLCRGLEHGELFPLGIALFTKTSI